MFGAPMSANDSSIAGIRAELDFLPKVLDGSAPFLGLCLGGQILARVLRGKVGPLAHGQVESGFTQIYPTEVGRDWFVESDIFYQWHREGFTAPDTATVLATGDVYPHQAFVYGENAIATQFHP